MTKPFLLIVNGAPATGKTYLSHWLSQQLDLPLLSKDDIKEELFNHFDCSSKEKSQALGAVSFDLLWLWLSKLMPFRQTLIIETSFNLIYSQPKIIDLTTSHNYATIQIYCQAEEQIRQQRFADRARSSQRHPGHQDKPRLPEITSISQYQPIDINGPTITVDTTSFDTLDLQAILDPIKQELIYAN